LSFYGKERYKKLLFPDEKMFTVEEIFNKKNEVYARSAMVAYKQVSRIERGHYPGLVGYII
jgi:hypothetical protein